MQETQETRVWSLGQEDSLEGGMATHTVLLPGKFHGQRNLAATVQGVARSRTWLSMHAPVGVVDSTKDLSLQWHCSLSGWPRTRNTCISAKACSRWACPLWISFLLSVPAVICHLHWPYTFKTRFKFGEKIYAWSTGFLKGCPVASGVAHLPEASSNCGAPLNCRQGTPAQHPAVPQGIPPPPGQASFCSISGRAPWLTVPETGSSYITRDGLHYWMELLGILLRNMLRLLLPPTRKHELLLNLKITTWRDKLAIYHFI